MKVLLVIAALGMSFSTFAKSSNQKIAYCFFTELKGGKVKVLRFADDKTERDIHFFHTIGTVNLKADITVAPGKMKKDKPSEVILDIDDSASQASSFATGFSIPGREVLTSLSLNGNIYEADCGVIDDKFLEENSVGSMKLILIKQEIDKNK